MARIAWHPAFVEAFQTELEEYLDVLTFEPEHQLTSEPLRIDLLVVRKKKNVVIKKNIARIFQSTNIIEYKSPSDRVTIENYHKIQCYARLCAALYKIDISDITVTVVSTRYPKDLLGFLKRRYTVERVERGIYYVYGDTCPTQVIVSKQLSDVDNVWLNNLQKKLSIAQLERLARAKRPRLPMDAYFQVVYDANAEALEELIMRKKEGVILSEKLDAYFTERCSAPWIAKGEARGEAQKAIAVAQGEARGKAEAVLTVLRARFKQVPKVTESAIRQMSDSIALDSWAAYAATCQSMDEFVAALK